MDEQEFLELQEKVKNKEASTAEIKEYEKEQERRLLNTQQMFSEMHYFEEGELDEPCY
jgi:hypothetical protein